LFMAITSSGSWQRAINWEYRIHFPVRIPDLMPRLSPPLNAVYIAIKRVATEGCRRKYGAILIESETWPVSLVHDWRAFRTCWDKVVNVNGFWRK